MKQPLHIVGTGLAALACLILVISLGTTGWLSNKLYNLGLFRLCLKDNCGSIDASGSFAAVQFFVVVGFLLSAIALVVSIIHFIKFVRRDVSNKMLPFVASMELLIAGACVILGCIIFAAKVQKDFAASQQGLPDKIGYSFGLAIVGALICFASGALILVQRNKAS